MYKKYKLVVVFMAFFVVESRACDVCGCANGGTFFGVLPQSHRSFVGVRYRLRSFDSHLTSVLFKSSETYQTTELWGRFYPFKRTQLLAFLPYNFNAQTVQSSGKTTKIQGFGDASVIMQYQVFTTLFDSTARRFDHSLLVGGGLKLPTGKFNYNANETVANANFQLGTGSLDYLVNMTYTLRKKSGGLNLETNYRIATANNQNYRFANRLSAAATLFRSIQATKALSLLPNAGFSAEYAKEDIKNGERNSYTGGFQGNLNLGTEVYATRFMAGFSVQVPVYQQLAKSDLKSKGTLSVHLTRYF
jgi:hypothetical protein